MTPVVRSSGRRGEGGGAGEGVLYEPCHFDDSHPSVYKFSLFADICTFVK